MNHDELKQLQDEELDRLYYLEGESFQEQEMIEDNPLGAFYGWKVAGAFVLGCVLAVGVFSLVINYALAVLR